VIAFLGVSASFLTLRKKFPDLHRPFRAPGGRFLGYVGVLGSLCILAIMVVPSSSVALVWPFEWAIFLTLSILGLVLWVFARKSRNKVSKEERDYLILEKFKD
jgi:amino acid transporter